MSNLEKNIHTDDEFETQMAEAQKIANDFYEIAKKNRSVSSAINPNGDVIITNISSLYDEPIPNVAEISALGDVGMRYELPSYIILDWINKYNIFKPQRTGEYRGRQIYAFSAEDLGRIERILFLKQLGYHLREIAPLMGDIDQKKQLSQEFLARIEQFYSAPTIENFRLLLEVIANDAEMTELEKQVWLYMSNAGSFQHCADMYTSGSVSQVREVMQSAEEKAGRIWKQLIYTSAMRQRAQQ